MEIATNAVFAALLLQASSFVNDVGVPLQTPLEASKVAEFNIGTSSGRDGPEIGCYLAYAGGYEFRHSHGCIYSFNTRDALITCKTQRS
jgi:hypothetical protein